MRVALATLAVFLLGGCASTPNGPCGAPTLDRELLVLESDGSSSALATLGTDGCLDEHDPDLGYGADSALVGTSDAHTIVINRGEGLLFDVDTSDFSLLREYVGYPTGSTPASSVHSFPTDADRDGEGDLWIAELDRSYVGVMSSDGLWKGSVDLSDPALDPDGDPDMVGVRIVDGTAYVLLAHLANSVPTVSATVALVDTASRSVTETATLGGMNPLGPLHPFSGDTGSNELAVCLVGNPSLGAASPSDGVYTFVAEGFPLFSQVLAGPDLGGFCVDVAIVDALEGYVLTADYTDSHAMALRPFNPSTGVLGQPMITTNDFSLSGLAIDGARLVVGDRTAGTPHLVVFDRASKVKLGEIPTVQLPPRQIRAL